MCGKIQKEIGVKPQRIRSNEPTIKGVTPQKAKIILIDPLEPLNTEIQGPLMSCIRNASTNIIGVFKDKM